MKNNTIIKMIIIFMIFPMILAFIANTQAASNTVEVKYEYNEETNQVTAKIISDIDLKPTKPTWELSSDRKTYSKTFSSNTNYNTPVETINGEIIQININITQIQVAKIKTQYIYDEKTNQVTAQIISNTELKPTKPTWELSANKKVYAKTFANNTSYTTPVEDINGNIIQAEVNITQVKITNLKVEYIYDDITNQVTAQIISNIELKNTKPTWELSADKKVYTKKYSINQTYTTDVVDRYDNVITVEIKINQIDVTPPQITVEYKFNENDTITVYMKSNETLKNTKPTWSLSADKKTYEKTYEEKKQNYSTVVQDSHGIETNVKIDFNLVKLTYNQKDSSKISVRYMYTEHKKAEVEIISSIQMKDTKPTWAYKNNGYKYTKTFYEDQIYGTNIEDINGNIKNVNLIVNISDRYLHGIDVSVHQGKIDWEKVKKSGIDYAIIRCGYGQDMTSQDDKQFARNIAECERLGIPYGIYIYSYALNIDNVLSEADHVLRLIKGHNPEFGIWLDLEDDDYKMTNGMPSNNMFVDMTIAFCEKIKANGYNKVGVYANKYWLEYKLDDTRLDIYNKWVAQWSGNCTYDKLHQMWQYTDTGIVDGINGNVDMDIYYKW